MMSSSSVLSPPPYMLQYVTPALTRMADQNPVADNHATILSNTSSLPAGVPLLSSSHLSIMGGVDHEAFGERVCQRDAALPWTRKQIQLYSSLPIDIVRIVFEKAMEDEPLPVHLLRLSQQVRRW
jgi:hypothetical protein